MQNAEIDPVTKLILPEALYKTDQKKYSLSAILKILVKLTWAFAMKTVFSKVVENRVESSNYLKGTLLKTFSRIFLKLSNQQFF